MKQHLETMLYKPMCHHGFKVLCARGRGHDGLVNCVRNCVRTGMSISVSISKTCVAANAIYSHKFAGHDALVSMFVATCE